MPTALRGRLKLVNSLILLLALGISAVLLFLQFDHQFQPRDQERVDQRSQVAERQELARLEGRAGSACNPASHGVR